MERKLKPLETNVCLFCGIQKQKKWEEYQPYWECDCEDSIKERKILSKIEELEQQLPRPKFEIVEQLMLRTVNKYE
jgi:hypothetical protein